jgi:hypothetical protein
MMYRVSPESRVCGKFLNIFAIKQPAQKEKGLGRPLFEARAEGDVFEKSGEDR